MIYLNNASTSFPKPSEVINAVNDYLTNPPHNFGRINEKVAKNFNLTARQEIMDFFGADDSNYLVFSSGSTEALNLVIQGLELNNKNVMITATEHNSVIRPLKSLEKEEKLTTSVVDCDKFGFVEPEKIENAIQDNTALIIVNYTSNITGIIQDVAKIGKIAKKHNILFMIDASQAVGNIPIDLNKIHFDFFAFTGHKSLFGIQGIGGLLFKKHIDFKPLKRGGTGFRSNYLYQPDELPHKYEAGTQNIPGIISLLEGIRFIKKNNIDNIIEHKKKLIARLLVKIQKINNIILYYNPENYSSSVLSFNIEGIAPEEVNYILKSSFDIKVRSGLHCVPLIHNYINTSPLGTVRISPSYFTTNDEIDYFAAAITKIAEEFK